MHRHRAVVDTETRFLVRLGGPVDPTKVAWRCAGRGCQAEWMTDGHAPDVDAQFLQWRFGLGDYAAVAALPAALKEVAAGLAETWTRSYEELLEAARAVLER